MRSRAIAVLLAASILMMSGCAEQREAQQNVSTQESLEVSETRQETAPVIQEPSEELLAQMEVSEYVFKDGETTKHILIIQNNSDKTVSVVSHSKALGKKGAVVGQGSGFVNAVGSGAVSYIVEDMDTTKNVSECEYELEVAETKTYASVVENVEISVETVENKAVVSITNAGTKQVERLEGLAVFTKEGIVTNVVSCGISDEGSPMEQGAALVKEFDAEGAAFDDVQIYLRGYNENK